MVWKVPVCTELSQLKHFSCRVLGAGLIILKLAFPISWKEPDCFHPLDHILTPAIALPEID